MWLWQAYAPLWHVQVLVRPESDMLARLLPLAALPLMLLAAPVGAQGVAPLSITPVSPPGVVPPSVNPTPPSVDKSVYSLFNPTPEAALRGFSTDRPNKSNSPITVDAGHYQIETDILSGSYSRSRGITTRYYQFADPVLKAGLTNSVDFELGFGGYQQSVTTGGGIAAIRGSGFGDLTPRLKWNLLGNDGGDVQIAVIPYVKIPTAARRIGNGQVEGGAILTVGVNLPFDFTAIVQTEIDILKNGANNGKHANFVNLVNLSHAIYGDLTGSVELASQVTGDRGSTNAYTADFALSYALTPTLQLDAAAYVGLNRDAPRLTLYTGISRRF